MPHFWHPKLVKHGNSKNYVFSSFLWSVLSYGGSIVVIFVFWVTCFVLLGFHFIIIGRGAASDVQPFAPWPNPHKYETTYSQAAAMIRRDPSGYPFSPVPGMAARRSGPGGSGGAVAPPVRQKRPWRHPTVLCHYHAKASLVNRFR